MLLIHSHHPVKQSYRKIHYYQHLYGLLKTSINQTSNYSTIPLGNILPIASCVVTTATDHQTEHTLSPGTCAPAKCNNQPGIQYSGVLPTASSALSHVRTLLFVLRSHHLNTNDVAKFLFAMNIRS